MQVEEQNGIRKGLMTEKCLQGFFLDNLDNLNIFLSERLKNYISYWVKLMFLVNSLANRLAKYFIVVYSHTVLLTSSLYI